MTEVTAGPALGRGVAGESALRVCKRPGCGNPVPWSGRGRIRLFCGDACSRRFHNAGRQAAGGVAVSSEQAGDPLGALAALIGQAGSLITLARGQVAALDPEVVAVQLAEAEAARRRAEARAVTAEARAAEAGQEMLAALEAAEAADRGREAAEGEARRACEAAAQARRELAGAIAGAHADVEAAQARASRQAAEAAETARAERDRAGERAAALVHAAEAELARARQAEAGACDQVRQARNDAVRERDGLAEQYRARLEAAGHLAAAERDRAVRAEQLLDAERDHHHRLLAVLATAAGGGDDRAAPASGPCPRAGGAASPRRRHRQGYAVNAGKGTREPGRGRRHPRSGRCGWPARHRSRRATLIPGRGSILPCGPRARRFASSLITVLIRKEGTYVRAMRLAPARQLMLDIPGPERGPGRDPGRVWDQMPDAVQARVLRLLAVMIAAGVLAGSGEPGTGTVRGDG